MRRSCSMFAMAMLVTLSLALAANGQANQPPVTSEPVPGQQDSTSQPQPSDQATTPETQAKLAKEVGHALIMLPYFGVFDNLAFRLQGRTVILEGQVVRSSLKPDAERVVKKLEGVDKVVNNIEVLPPGPLDDQTRRAVYDAIYKYGPLFKYSNQPNPPIRIIVRNANVTLEGVVDTETDKGLVSMRVKQVPSVLNVTNNLRVLNPNSGKDKKN